MFESKEFQDWLATRLENVQALAKEFPPGFRFLMPSGKIAWLIGWGENDVLIVSEIDPYRDFDRAFDEKQYLHADCARKAVVGT